MIITVKSSGYIAASINPYIPPAPPAPEPSVAYVYPTSALIEPLVVEILY